MSAMETWPQQNEAYNQAALAWLRRRLEQMADGRHPEAAAEQAVMHAGADTDAPPALALLGEALGLSAFEQQVLLLGAAHELDTQMGALYARAQDNRLQPYPTLALALALFDQPEWDVLSPERPLRYWQLIEIDQAAGQPVTASPLRVDERILSYLKGLNHLDSRLSHLLAAVAPAPVGIPLAASQAAVVDGLVAALSAGQTGLVQLVGHDVQEQQYLAQQAAVALGLHLYRLPVTLLPAGATEMEQFIRLWQRESALMPLALFLDATELDEASASPAATGLTRLLERRAGVIFLADRSPWPHLPPEALTVDVARPTRAEQFDTWQAFLDPTLAEQAMLLAGQFDLSLPAVHQVVERIRQTPGEEDGTAEARFRRLWDECRAFTRPRLEMLAQRLIPKATWDDIVLPERRLHLLRQIADQVRQRTQVYESWQFQRKMNRGFGISVLFAGDSGTGKTMAAEVIANELRLDLYRIDLSAVVNKYIGETEKNLRRLFDAAEDGGAILFFDEADALFGKRSEVKDSHDRYANIEINYLLQRMEAYRGLAILATNMKSALDQAFLRRLRFIIDFPFPGSEERRAIWQKAFPTAVPGLEDLDFERLARFSLAGGSIHVIALNATFAAAAAGGKLTMPLVLDAVETELEKLEMPVNRSLLAWPSANGARG